MKKKPATPAPDRTPEQALERMKEFTRRIAAVPKAEAIKRKPKAREHRYGRT
jgi:hypothetical protein